jgi:hypothetical protein
MANSTLATYLNDHLAGATGAISLLDHLIETTQIANGKEFFTTIRAEVWADRQTLHDLLQRCGGELSGLRQVGGWIGERVNRFKLLLDDPNKNSLHLLEPLEILSLGIQGKAALWRALAAAQSGLSELAGVDFAALESRANDQYARVEKRRIDAARQVLTDAAFRPST